MSEITSRFLLKAKTVRHVYWKVQHCMLTNKAVKRRVSKELKMALDLCLSPSCFWNLPRLVLTHPHKIVLSLNYLLMRIYIYIYNEKSLWPESIPRLRHLRNWVTQAYPVLDFLTYFCNGMNTNHTSGNTSSIQIWISPISSLVYRSKHGQIGMHFLIIWEN